MVSLEQMQLDVAEAKQVGHKILALLLNKAENQPQTENPIKDGIKGVSKLIGKTVPTIYGYCQRNEIPHAKQGNRLIFFESEIIAWLKSGKVKTIQEIEADGDAFLLTKKKK
jgi:predicted DNA-binding transcriptional regulator AlpA